MTAAAATIAPMKTFIAWYLLVDVVSRVVDVEVAGRRDDARILDHGLELARLVVHHHQRGLLVLRAPYREPHLVAGLIVFRLHDALGAFAEARPVRDRQ